MHLTNVEKTSFGSPYRSNGTKTCLDGALKKQFWLYQFAKWSILLLTEESLVILT